MTRERPAVGDRVPLISVILPAWNAASYISTSIHSILSQSVEDFELIVIDDGSTDATGSIVQDIAAQDWRIRLVSRENRGLVRSLNEGIDLARGRWIARMDADDIALPIRFERQLEWLGQTGAGMSGSWLRRFGTYDRRVVKFPVSDDAIKAEMLFRCPFAHPTMMIESQILRDSRYDPSWRQVEDYELWTRLSLAGVKMTNVPEVLLLYRVHDAQVSATAAIEQESATIRVRRIHWNSVHASLGLERGAMDAVFRIAQDQAVAADMDAVHSVLSNLARQWVGEARRVVLASAFRSYLSAASASPDIAKRWRSLCSSAGERAKVRDLAKLAMLALFRIRPRGRIFSLLRRLQILVGRGTQRFGRQRY